VEVASSVNGDPSVPYEEHLGHIYNEDIDDDILEQQVNNIFNLDDPFEDLDYELALAQFASHWCIGGICT
jgi:hypothetical protein